jgi:uncharacterized protein (UPF0335 family)
MTDVNAAARAELRSFIERIERLEEEKAAISGDIKDVKGEAKGRGYNVGAINTIIKLRKKDANERAEEEAILDTYMAALGMIPQPDLFEEPHDRETGELSPRLAKQVVDGMQTEAGRAVLMAAVDIMIERDEAEVQNSPETANETPKQVYGDSGAEATALPSQSVNIPAGGDEASKIDGSDEQCPADDNSPETAKTQRVNGHSQHEGANAQAIVRNEVVTVAGTESGTVSNSEIATASQGEAEAPTGSTSGPTEGGDHEVNEQQSFAAQAGASVQVAPAAKLLRPHCQRPTMCGSGTTDHCHSCKVAMREREVA